MNIYFDNQEVKLKKVSIISCNKSMGEELTNAFFNQLGVEVNYSEADYCATEQRKSLVRASPSNDERLIIVDIMKRVYPDLYAFRHSPDFAIFFTGDQKQKDIDDKVANIILMFHLMTKILKKQTGIFTCPSLINTGKVTG